MATGGGGGGGGYHGGLNEEDDEFACLPWRRMSPLLFDELRQRTGASLAAFSTSAAAVGAEDEMMSNDGYIWEDDIVGKQSYSAGAALCPALGGPAADYPDFPDYCHEEAAEDVGKAVEDEEEAELTGWRGFNQNLAMLSLGLQVLQAQRMPVTATQTHHHHHHHQQQQQQQQQSRHQGRPSAASATSAAASASRASAQLSAWLASVYAADEVAAAAAGVGIRQPPPLNSPASPAASIAGGASRSGQQQNLNRRQQRRQLPQHLDDSTVTSTCALADLDNLDSLDGIAGGPPADDPDQLSQALLRMSASPADCSRLRQGQPYSLVLPLLYGTETRDPCPGSLCPSPHANLPPRQVRDRAAQILANLADCPEAGAKEKLILCHLDQVRLYCDAVRATLCRCGQLTSPTSPPPSAAVLDNLRERCCSGLSVLLELSYSDTDRPAIAELGGVECLSDLLLVDFWHTQYLPPPCSQFLRRYAASALTNLSYGDAACKRRVCLRAPAVWSLVEQLKPPPTAGVQQPPVEEELCQVTAAVIRNLSWQADAECRAVLGRLGAAGVLARAALQVRRESTLRSLLSALWNLSAHSTANKEAICAVPGSLGLLCACLTCNHSLAETGGGVLRNISSVVAVREDLRAAVRPAFPVLLTQLRSESLTVVANACGILWNLSSNHLADQRLLTRLGAVPMLRFLVQSKHKVIRLASASALKNLVSARLHDSAELPPPHHAANNNPRIGSASSSGSSSGGNRSRSSSSSSSQQVHVLGGRQQITTAVRSSSAAPSAPSLASSSKPSPTVPATAAAAVPTGTSGSPRPLLCSPQRSASQDSLRSAVSDVTHDRANQQPLSASVHYNSSGRSELTLPQCVRLAGAVDGPPDEEEDGSSGGGGLALECAVSCGAATPASVAETPVRAPATSAAISAPASAHGGSVQPTPLVFSRGSSGHSLDSVGLDSLRSSRASSYSAGTGGRSAGPPLSPSCLPDTPSEQIQPQPQPQPLQLRQIQRQTQPQRIPGASRHRRVASSRGSETSSSAASSSSKDEDDGLDSQILQDCIRSGMPPAKPRTTRSAAAAAVAAKAITTTDDRPTVFHVEHTPSPPSSVDLNYGGDEQQQQQQQQQQKQALKASSPSTRPLVSVDDDVDVMDDIENDNNGLENDDDEADEVAAALALDDEDEAVLDMDINVGIGEEEDDAIANAIVEEDDDVASVGQSGAARVAPTAASRSDEKTVTYKTEDTPAHFSYRTSAQTSSRSSSCSSDNADLLLEACISSAMPKKQQQQAAAAARARPSASGATNDAANADIGDCSSNASVSSSSGSSISSNSGSNNKASFFWIGFDGGKQRPQQQQLTEALANREAGPSKPRTLQALPTGSADRQQQVRLPPPAPPRQPAPGSSSSNNKLHLVHQQHRLACRLHAGTDRRLYTLTEERSSPSPVELRDADRQSSSGGSRTSAEAPGRPIDSRTFSIHSDEEPAAGQLTLELSDIDTSDLSGSSMEIDAAAIRESPHASAANAGLAGFNGRNGADLVDASQDTDTDLDLTDEDDDGDATGALFGFAKSDATPTPPPPPPVPIASTPQSLEGSAASRLRAPKPIVARTSWVPVSPSALASRLPTPGTASVAKRPSVGGGAKPSVIPAPKLTPTPSKLPASVGSSIPAPSSAARQQQQQQQQPGTASMLSGGGKPLGIVAPTPVRSSLPAPSFSPSSISASASGAAAASVPAGRRSKDSGYSADSSPAGSLDSGSPAQRFTLQVTTTSSASSSAASGSTLLRRQQSPITFNLTISSGGGGGDSEAASTICDDDVDEVSVDIIDEDASSSLAPPPESPTETSAAGVGRARIVKRPKSADSAPGPPKKLVGGCGGRGGSVGRGRVSSIGGSPVRQPLSIRRANATNVRLNKSAVARLGGGGTNGGSSAAQQQQRQLPRQQQPRQPNSQQQKQQEKQIKLSQGQERPEQRQQQQQQQVLQRQQKQLPQRQQNQEQQKQEQQQLLPQRQQKQEQPEQQKQEQPEQQKQEQPEQQKQLPQRQHKQEQPEQQKQLPQRQQKQLPQRQQKQLPQRQQKQEQPEQQKQPVPQRQQKQQQFQRPEQSSSSAQKPPVAAGRSAVKHVVHKPSSAQQQPQQQQQQQSSALTDSVTTSSSISSSESGAIWITKEEVAEVLCRTSALVS